MATSSSAVVITGIPTAETVAVRSRMLTGHQRRRSAEADVDSLGEWSRARSARPPYLFARLVTRYMPGSRVRDSIRLAPGARVPQRSRHAGDVLMPRPLSSRNVARSHADGEHAWPPSLHRDLGRTTGLMR
jgi:hypothetical protein